MEARDEMSGRRGRPAPAVAPRVLIARLSTWGRDDDGRIERQTTGA